MKPRFQLPNWIKFSRSKYTFSLSFENNTGGASYKRYHLLAVERKDYSFMTDGRNSFHQPIKNALRTNDNIQKFTIDEGYGYAAAR